MPPQLPDSALFRADFHIVRPVFPWFASVLLALCCALRSVLGQGALAGGVATPGPFPSLDRDKESLPVSLVGDLLPDERVRPAPCTKCAGVLLLECLDSSLLVGCECPSFASVQQDRVHWGLEERQLRWKAEIPGDIESPTSWQTRPG